jgi:hypothetical protein
MTSTLRSSCSATKDSRFSRNGPLRAYLSEHLVSAARKTLLEIPIPQGVDVEVMGETRTVQVDDFEEWIDDIGDGGAWSPKGGGLSVIHEGVILTVTASGFGDEQDDRARAKELAAYIINGN